MIGEIAGSDGCVVDNGVESAQRIGRLDDLTHAGDGREVSDEDVYRLGQCRERIRGPGSVAGVQHDIVMLVCEQPRGTKARPSDDPVISTRDIGRLSL